MQKVRKKVLKKALLLPLLGIFWLWPQNVAALDLLGFVALRGQHVDGPESWLTGGFGRLGVDAQEDGETFASGNAQLVLDWRPGERFGGFAHLVGRLNPSDTQGREGGVFEAYLRSTLNIGQGDQLRFRLGHFLLPSSKENVELAWSSPYTLTFSALNSWIGEEVRLTGLLSEYKFSIGPIHQLRIGGTIFGGNDTAGALLAWRGWAQNDHLATFGETLPLPPLDSLDASGPFSAQRDRGTQPFGSDLDGRPGWAAYLLFRLPEQFSVQYTHYDNRGDRDLHNGDEYAWATDFDLLGGEYHWRQWSFAAEFMTGSTGMGLPYQEAQVQMDFEAAYALASVTPGPFRLTLRYDHFDGEEADFSPAEINDDEGHSWTFALFWEPNDRFRLGLELVDLEGERPAALESGFALESDAQSVLLEARYYFGL